MNALFSKSSQKSWQRQTDLFLHNTWVLFAFFLFTVAMILYLACHEDILSLLVLFLVGFVFYFFTSNMVVILSLALVFTGVIRFMNLNDSQQLTLGSGFYYPWYMIEGMKDGEEEDEVTDISGRKMLPKEPVPANSVKTEPVAAPTTTSLLEQTFPNEPTTSDDLEKLKLQHKILEKLEVLQPFITTFTTLFQPSS